MQEQTSSWFSAPSRLLSKAMSAASYGVRCTWNAATAAPVAAVTLATQIPGAIADSACFNVPGNSVPYLLDCDTYTTAANLTKTLETTGTGITAAQLYQCVDFVYHNGYQNLANYGKSVLGDPVCSLLWNGDLNSFVNNVLTQNTPNGVWTTGASALVVFLSMVGGAIVLGVGSCVLVHFCKRKSGAPLLEDTRVARTEDQEDAVGSYQTNARAPRSSSSPSVTDV